ncbi:collagen alpha-5(IV) chain-like [Vidua macroura]|uniref:collagen alpha-5(IV) chain-like n=1 Tax=Vidua macroura TaxID=187451 RepID=UPI0023A8BCEA|nr:collagen alpha-5(IV) chain-like [Vidua macroura]
MRSPGAQDPRRSDGPPRPVPHTPRSTPGFPRRRCHCVPALSAGPGPYSRPGLPVAPPVSAQSGPGAGPGDGGVSIPARPGRAIVGRRRRRLRLPAAAGEELGWSRRLPRCAAPPAPAPGNRRWGPREPRHRHTGNHPGRGSTGNPPAAPGAAGGTGQSTEGSPQGIPHPLEGQPGAPGPLREPPGAAGAEPSRDPRPWPPPPRPSRVRKRPRGRRLRLRHGGK